MIPIDSPWWATKDTPRTACTSVTAPAYGLPLARKRRSRDCLPTGRGRRFEPNTRYVTCRSCTTTDGSPSCAVPSARSGRSSASISKSMSSLTSVPRLGPPEEHEPYDEEQHTPAGSPRPHRGVERDVGLVEKSLPREVEVHRDRLVAHDRRERRVVDVAVDREDDARHVHQHAQHEGQEVAEVRDSLDDAREHERDARREQVDEQDRGHEQEPL